MELNQHSTASLQEELQRRDEAATSKPRRVAVAQTLRAVANAIEDDNIVVDGDRLDKVAAAAFEMAWKGMPGGSCRQTSFTNGRGVAQPDRAESGMDLGWAKVLGFKWPENMSSWDIDDRLGAKRDAVLSLVNPSHTSRHLR